MTAEIINKNHAEKCELCGKPVIAMGLCLRHYKASRDNARYQKMKTRQSNIMRVPCGKFIINAIPTSDEQYTAVVTRWGRDKQLRLVVSSPQLHASQELCIEHGKRLICCLRMRLRTV